MVVLIAACQPEQMGSSTDTVDTPGIDTPSVDSMAVTTVLDSAGNVIVADTISVNLFKVLMADLALKRERTIILSDS